MIITKLQGGLGNQLFQYAAGKSLSLFKNTSIKLDISWYHSSHDITEREYLLDRFRIDTEIATPKEIKDLTEAGFLFWLLPYYKQRVFSERQFSFDPNFFRSSQDTYLLGYWQSERYFNPYQDIIRQNLELKEEISSVEISDLYTGNTVGVHIRRGDYVSNSKVAQIHGALGMDYYKRAMETMEKLHPGARFLVFSDDAAWAKEHFLKGPGITVMDTKSRDPLLDFSLLRECSHFIIANSTFSWWAAWLGKAPGKTVMAPREWFKDKSKDTSDIIPEAWIKL